MKIAFKTFGCRANSLDTDVLLNEARRRGYSVVADTEAADAYVINSCTVTSAADREARLFAMRYKRRNPDALVGVIGCYAQVAKEELLALAEVDFVLGSAEKVKILDCFTEANNQSAPARDQVTAAGGFLPEVFPGSRHSRASVKIQDGCNFSCSYCIIPKARGRSRSLPIEKVLAQIERAHAEGFNEIVLTGIHLAHYGWDKGTDLMALLRGIFANPSNPRVRVSTLDPFEIPDEMIQLLREEPRFCPYFHIALQSGSDRVLSSMRRIYKAKEFDQVTEKLKTAVPDTFIGVDVIVGFPGETEAEFEETVTRLESTPWTKLHVFPFSVRPGTRAELLDGKMDKEALAERSLRLRELSDRRQREFFVSQLGTKKRVLVETEHKKKPGIWKGHTENYLPVLIPAGALDERKILDCRLDQIDGDWISASPI